MSQGMNRSERAKLRQRVAGRWVGCTTNRLLDELDAKDALLASVIALCEKVLNQNAEDPPYDYAEDLVALKKRADLVEESETPIHFLVVHKMTGDKFKVVTACRNESDGANLATLNLAKVTCEKCKATIAVVPPRPDKITRKNQKR